MKKVRNSKLKKKRVVANSPTRIIKRLIVKGEVLEAIMIFLQVAGKLTSKKFFKLQPMIVTAFISYIKKEKIRRLVIQRKFHDANVEFSKTEDKLIDFDFKETNQLMKRVNRWATTKNGSSSFRIKGPSHRSGNGAK